MTLFILVHDARLVIISEAVFLVFGATTLINALNQKKIPKSILFLNVTLLSILSLSSIIWAVDQSIALSSVKTVFQLFLLFILVFLSIKTKEDITMCIKSFFLGGLVMSLYSFVHYGLTNILVALRLGNRLGGDINQENIFGYLSALTAIIAIYYAIQIRQIRYLILSLLPIVFVITSGSRRGVMILLFGILTIIFMRSISSKSKIKIYLKVLLAVLVILFLLEQVIYLDVFSRLESIVHFITFDGDIGNSLNVRYKMIVFGFELFKAHPLFGVGINQYRSWFNLAYGAYRPAHNGYIQTLADMGLVGFMLYYGMFLIVLMKLWSLIKKNKEYFGLETILIVMICLHLLSDLATNSFYDKITYIILGLAFGFVEITNSVKQNLKS
jgi:O-antigen ligase